MEFYKYAAVWILCNIINGSGTVKVVCGNSNNCFCTKSMYDTEFQCPDEKTPKIIIKAESEYDVVNIHCIESINWDDEKLPLLEIENVDYFRFRQCPLPTSFVEIMNRVKVNNTKELKFDYSKGFANITLTADYFEGLHNLERLILNSNDIKDIDEDAFQSLDKLVELDLDHNKVQLTNGLFKDLSTLKVLALTDNEIPQLPSEIFQNLTELKYLHLWSNRLTTVNNSVFKNLRSLELLELSRNQLEYLPENVFDSLQNLKKVGLSTNKLQRIPENLFRKNKLLEVVMMNRNPTLTYLPDNLFSNLTKLGEISLSDCKLTNLSNNLFEGSIHLQNISLQQNEMQHISENVFKGLTELLKLDLSYNKIEDLPNEGFSSLIKLKTLNLESNSLTSIRAEPFVALKSLEKLNLKNNKISSIELDSFQRVYSLKEIILANNYFDLPQSDLFGVSLFNNNQELEKVDLSNNNITVMGDFLTYTKLRELDLSYNQINYISFNEVFTVAFPIHINLKHNNITTVDFAQAEVIARSQEKRDTYTSNSGNIKVSLDGNPIECNCHVYDFVRYFDRSIDPMVPTLVTIEADELTCSSPNDFINFPVRKLKPNMLTCSLYELGIEDRFTEKCSYGFRPWDTSLVVRCTNSNFTELPELILPAQNFFNQTELYFQENLLTSGPKENMGYENVTKLFLSSNNINEVTWIPPKLKVLELHNNNISYLNSEVLTKLNSSSLTNITFGKNPWSCDCSTENVLSFLQSNLARKQIDANSIECRNSGKLLVRLSSEDICPSNTALVLGLGITFSLIALLIAVFMALYYRFQQEVKVWLFAHNMFLWFVTEDEIDKDKLYDAFVSYSHKDEDFVLKELLPTLEQGPQPYKLCIHVRDWVPGEFISKQIATSVTESRRTLIILSREFLDSEWGKMEFRTAHKQAIHEGRARVILILYGNIDIDLDLDDELKAYVRTNTYVKWGDPWFWDKLRYALPHSRVKIEKSSQKNQNIMVAINEKLDKLDDKLDLINATSSTPNPGSTPPIDPLLLKNNPLTFTSGKALTPPAESGLDALVITVNK